MRRDVLEAFQTQLDTITHPADVEVTIGSYQTVAKSEMPVIVMDFIGEEAFEDDDGIGFGSLDFRMMEVAVAVVLAGNEDLQVTAMDWIDAVNDSLDGKAWYADGMVEVGLQDVEIETEPEGLEDCAIVRLSFDALHQNS